MNLMEMSLVMCGIIWGATMLTAIGVAILCLLDKNDDCEKYLKDLNDSILAEFCATTYEKQGDEFVAICDFDEDLYITKESETEKRIKKLEQLESLIDTYRASKGYKAI